ncbi:MAG TPA: family 16 glycosylhydrolase [Gammaproteobacteria bacterium]
MKTSQFLPYLVGNLLLAAVIAAFPLTAVAKPYKGAEIFTHDAWHYGKYVMRLRAAKGGGIISAFFLWKDGSEMPNIPWEEVDIEVMGRDNAETWQSNIITGLGEPRITSEQEHHAGFSFGDDYHTFTLEWTPNSLTWRVDGEIVRTANDGQVSDLISEAQIRFNVWASESVEWAGAWDGGILPVYMLVDWIEYYAWNGAAFETVPAWRDDFGTFDTNRWGKADWTFDGNRADFIPGNAYVENGALVLALTPETQSGSSSSSSSSSSSGGSGGGGGLGLLIAAFWGFLLKKMYRYPNGI